MTKKALICASILFFVSTVQAGELVEEGRQILTSDSDDGADEGVSMVSPRSLYPAVDAVDAVSPLAVESAEMQNLSSDSEDGLAASAALEKRQLAKKTQAEKQEALEEAIQQIQIQELMLAENILNSTDSAEKTAYEMQLAELGERRQKLTSKFEKRAARIQARKAMTPDELAAFRAARKAGKAERKQLKQLRKSSTSTTMASDVFAP